MTRFLTVALAAFLAAAPAAAQTDPSNPAGAPTAPSQGPTSKASQGTVIRNAAPGQDLDPNNQPLPPSTVAGVEEPQRTQTVDPKAKAKAAPAPIEDAPNASSPNG